MPWHLVANKRSVTTPDNGYMARVTTEREGLGAAGTESSAASPT